MNKILSASACFVAVASAIEINTTTEKFLTIDSPIKMATSASTWDTLACNYIYDYSWYSFYNDIPD
jgi:hypothetical protein